MDTTYDDAVFDFDLNLLQQTPNSPSVQNRLEKQRKSIATVKKKTVATDSLIRKYYAKREVLDQTEKVLLASKEECKQICIDYRNALANCTKLENDAQLLQLKNKELEEKCFHATNQTGAVQSHANQLQLLVKQHETVIEGLRIENRLDRSNPKDERKIISLQKEKEALLKDICLFKDIVLGKRKRKKCHDEILQKYQKLSINYCDEDSDEESNGNDDNTFEDVPFCEQEIEEDCQENNQNSALVQKLSGLKDENIRDSNLKNTGNAHEYDCSTEVKSVDTGRGSSLAYSDSEKCFHSPDYVMNNSPLTSEIHKPKMVDAATSPIEVHEMIQMATSPIHFEHEPIIVISDVVIKPQHLVDRAVSPLKLTKHVEVSTSPIKYKSIGIATSPHRDCKKPHEDSLKNQEKQCLELNSSNKICDENTSDSEIEMILSMMSINHRAISPIPPTPARPQDADIHVANEPIRQKTHTKGHVREEIAFTKEELIKLNANVANHSKRLDYVTRLIENHLLLNPNCVNNQVIVPNQGLLHDNVIMSDHEELYINVSETNKDNINNQPQNETKLHIEQQVETHDAVEESNLESESDLIQIHEIVDSNNYDLIEPLDDIPGPPVSHRLQFEQSVLSPLAPEDDAHEYGEYINTTQNVNSNETHQQSEISSQQNQERPLKRKRLTRLEKLRKKLLPKCKIRRETPTFKKMRRRPKPLPAKRIIKETDSSASLNERSVYEKAVKIMSELKSRQNITKFSKKHSKTRPKILQIKQKLRDDGVNSKKKENLNNNSNFGAITSKDVTSCPSDEKINKDCFVAICSLDVPQIINKERTMSHSQDSQKSAGIVSPRKSKSMSKDDTTDFQLNTKSQDSIHSPRSATKSRNASKDKSDSQINKKGQDIPFSPRNANTKRSMSKDSDSSDSPIIKKYQEILRSPRSGITTRNMSKDSDKSDCEINKKCQDVPLSPRCINTSRSMSKDSVPLDSPVNKKYQEILHSPKSGITTRNMSKDDKSNSQLNNKLHELFSPRRLIMTRSMSTDSNLSDAPISKQCQEGLCSPKKTITTRNIIKQSDTLDSKINKKSRDVPLSPRSAITTRCKDSDSLASANNKKCQDSLNSPRCSIKTRSMSIDSHTSNSNARDQNIPFSPEGAGATRSMSKDSDPSDSPNNKKCQDVLHSPRSSITTRSMSKDSDTSGSNKRDQDVPFSPKGAIVTRSDSESSDSQIVVCIIEELDDSSQAQDQTENAKNSEQCSTVLDVKKALKRSAEEDLETPSKRVLRSAAHKPINGKSFITTLEPAFSCTLEQKINKSPMTSETGIAMNTTKVQNSDSDRLVTYADLQLFSDNNNTEQYVEDRSTKCENSNPKDSILCSMIEKYGIKSVKHFPKKISDSAINAICKKLEESIAKIIELPQNETNNAMKKLAVDIQNMNMKHFIVGLIHYLKDPARKIELFNKIFCPPAPAMTKSEQVLLYVVTQVQMACPSTDLIGNILDNLEFHLFKLNKTPEFDAIESMSHFYAILCRYIKAKSRLRLFILDAMYCIQYKAIALIKQCIEVWMHILPLAHMGVAKSPLVTCLVYLLHFYKCEDRFNRVQDMRNILNRKYFYKITEWNETKILQMLQTSIMELREIPIEKKMLRMALIIISKRHGPKWCQNHIVKNLLLPIIENESILTRIRLFCVSMLGPVIKPYPNNMKVHCEIVMNQLLDIFRQNPSHQMQEAIVSSLIYLSRHNQYRVNQLLLTWKPKQVSPDLEVVLRDYVREKPIKAWESILSRVALS